MPKVKNNPLLKGVSGMLGDVVVYRQVNGETIMSNRPTKPDKPTKHQLEIKRNLQAAAHWGKVLTSTPENKALYATRIDKKRTSAYAVAVNDFLKAPTINAIYAYEYTGKPGSTIIIDAIDDFEVIKVTVTLCDDQGVLIETGEATLMPTLYWQYTATTENKRLPGTKIIVTAEDRPGNKTKLEETLSA